MAENALPWRLGTTSGNESRHCLQMRTRQSPYGVTIRNFCVFPLTDAQLVNRHSIPITISSSSTHFIANNMATRRDVDQEQMSLNVYVLLDAL